MPKYECVVKGCVDVGSVRHKFPSREKKENLFREWSMRIGRLDYIDYPILGALARVCGSHFAAIDCKRGGELKENAVPTLNLPEIGQYPGFHREKVVVVNKTRDRKQKTACIRDPPRLYSKHCDPVEDHNYILKERNLLLGLTSAPVAAKRVIEAFEEHSVFPKHSGIAVIAKGVIRDDEEYDVFTGHSTAAVAGEREIGELGDDKEDKVFTGHSAAAVAGEREIGELGNDKEDKVFTGPSAAAVAGEREVGELGDDEEDNVFTEHSPAAVAGEREVGELGDDEEDNVFTGHSAAAVTGEREIGELGDDKGHAAVAGEREIGEPEDDEEHNVFPGYRAVAVVAKMVLGDDEEHNVFPGLSRVPIPAKRILKGFEEHDVNPGGSGVAVAANRVLKGFEEYIIFPEPSSVAVTGKRVTENEKEHNVLPRPSGEVVAVKRVTIDGIEHHVFPAPSGALFTAKKVRKGFEEFITFPELSGVAVAGKRVTEDDKERNVFPGQRGVAITAKRVLKDFEEHNGFPGPRAVAVAAKRVLGDDEEHNVFPGHSGAPIAAKRVLKGFEEFITFSEPSGVAVAGKRVTQDDKDISFPVGPGSSITVATQKNDGSTRKMKGILRYVGSTQQQQQQQPSVDHPSVALRKQKLHFIILEARRQLKYIQRRNNCTLKERFAIATRFRDSTCLEDSFSHFNSFPSRFILPLEKPRRPKYSQVEKAMALVLYNGGPKCYPFLAKIFSLPSPATMNNVLDSVSLKPGFNQNLFDRLERKVDSMADIQKYCILMFDEMSISPHLIFNADSGIIEGFEDNGNVRRNKFADHALVLMVKGLTVPYKQPVFFSFSEGGTNYLDLKEILRTVLSKLLDCGLKPVATVCDQGTVNRRVVKSMLEDTRTSCLSNETEYKGGYFMVNENMIFPIFDTPHLLKSVRNNLLNKDLVFYEGGIKILASWDNLVTAYNLVPAETFKRVYGVTDKHIVPDKINKMKFKVASEVFSDKMSAGLETLYHLRPEAFAKNPLETARVLQFFDALFASFNGTSVLPKGGKKYCVALSNYSPHIQLWNESLKIMNTMKYVHKTTGANIRTLAPVIDNWIFSIHGIIKLWNLLEDCGFKHLKCGYLNLVPLEKVFRNIRSRALRKPTTTVFMAAYKSLMVCNFLLCSLSPGINNCEADDSTIPSNITDIFAQSTSSTLISNVTSLSFVTIPDKDAQFGEICNSFSMQTSSTDPYIAEFLFKSMLITIRRCEECKSSCVGDPYDPINSFKLFPEIHAAGKLYPSKSFALNALEIHYVVEYVLNHNCENVHIVHIIKETILKYVCFDWIYCQGHKKKLIESILKFAVPYVIRAWCADINSKLCGQDRKPYKGPDSMRKMALLHYLKSAKCRNRRRMTLK